MGQVNFRALLYQLKKDYGTRASWVTIVASEADDETGDRQIVRKTYDLPVVRLPQRMVRQFVQDIGYLAANKNFTYGALNDFDVAMFVIDFVDMPKDLDVDLNGWLNFGNLRYDRNKIDRFGDFCFMVTAKALIGPNPYGTLKLQAGSNLLLSQRVKVEMN